MRTMKRLIPVPVILALAACAANVRTDHATDVAFSQYQSFAWSAPTRAAVQDPVLNSQLLDERVKNSVFSALLGRGFSEAAKGAVPDFYVTYHTTSREKIESYGFNSNIGFVTGSPHGFGSVIVPFPANQNIESRQEAALVIDILDGRTHKLVWRGWMTGTVTEDRFKEPELGKEVRRILQQFPPR